MPIKVNLAIMMAKQKMSLYELSEKADLTASNFYFLTNGKAKGIRFNILEAICEVFDCQPGDILEYSAEKVNQE